MIHVTICQNKKGEYLGFDAKGHAGYAEAGDDIVCAAASILMINTANALELYADAGLVVSGKRMKDSFGLCWKVSPQRRQNFFLRPWS